MIEKDFREAVRAMRKYQKAYFANRRHEDLVLSKDWERRVDWELKQKAQTPDLFGPEGAAHAE